MNLNDVEAGKYQLVAVRWDKIKSKPGEPLDFDRYKRGDIVELNVEDAKRLVAAGAVVKPGELEKSKAQQAREIAERAQRDYEAILAGLPEDVRAEIAPDTVPVTDPDTGGGSPPPPPASGWWGDGKEPTTVTDILKAVGEDRAKATAALEAEQAGQSRKTLVEPLQTFLASSAEQ